MTKVNTQIQRKRLAKQLTSLENKMHPLRTIWWNSLTLSAKFSLLYKWNLYKKNIHPKKAKLKHFLTIYQSRYRPTINNQRNSIIEHLINN